MTFLSAKNCKNIRSENVKVYYFSLFPNLLGDVLVNKFIDVCKVKPKFLQQLDSPEHIFHRKLSLGAPVLNQLLKLVEA